MNLPLMPLIFLILVLPLGVAGQNIGSGCAGAVLLVILLRQLRNDPTVIYTRLRPFLWPLGAALAYLALMLVSTALNPENPSKSIMSAVNGHLVWAFLPALLVANMSPLKGSDWLRLGKFFALISAVMGGIAISQALIGWKVSGSSFVAGPTRAQGLYSHPLTFAYVALLLFPAAVHLVITRPRLWLSWTSFAGMAAVVAASGSRTVQLICLVVVTLGILLNLRGRSRAGFLAVLFCAIVLVISTDNPVQRRFSEFRTGTDVQGPYADDRLAFWVANFEMVRDRPVLGHGENLSTAYRMPYYERIGLPGFVKPYEAHNMYLQILVNSGVAGLVLFVAWLVWHLTASWKLMRSGGREWGWLSVMVCLAAGAITQNAFQDAEVRFTLSMVTGLMWLRLEGQRSAAHQ